MEVTAADKVMRIGELSRRSGINKQLIHYYLRMNYLHPPFYKSGNQAFYNQQHLDRLLFLKKCSSEAIPLAHAAALWEKNSKLPSGQRLKRKPGSYSDSKTRKQIIQDASQIFLRKGYNQATIAEIMDSVGITKPSFYYYFKNKKDLYITCLGSIFDAFSKRALDSIRREKTPMGRLEKRWKAGHAHSNRVLTSINLLKDSLRQEDSEERSRAEDILRKAWIDPLAKDLERGIAKGDIRPMNSEIASFALISLLDTFSYREILDAKYGPDLVLETVYDIVLHGLSKRT